jgi:hypothetical protein
MKQREYVEGPEAFANFERFAKEILQAPKPKGKMKKETKTANSEDAKSSSD